MCLWISHTFSYLYRGISGISFANKGRILHVVGTNGMVSTLKSENGELIGEFKASKKPISSLAFSSGQYLSHIDRFEFLT